MSLHQTSSDVLQIEKPYSEPDRVRAFARLRWRVLGRMVAILLVVLLAGGGAVPAQQARTRQYTLAVAGWGFDLLEWEARALMEKAGAALNRSAENLESAEASKQVQEYLERAAQIGLIEADITRALSEGYTVDNPEVVRMQEELGMLRAAQQDVRPDIEKLIQIQVSKVIADRGFSLFGRAFPPVQFTFTEPPKKLIVSPRDRIAIAHSKMLDSAMPLSEIEIAEGEIESGDSASAYITNIGGLGAFPTMVVDRASIEWVLSTVAHEWAHNYLVFYPLGWNYFKSQDMTTLNETVAEIVGNEIGANTLRAYFAQPEQGSQPDGGELMPAAPPEFDFRQEMRETRLEVDRLLADGKIDQAEQYMERRRRSFVENGYPLRVLNQAYFAFHGSYGTSAASTSPIGPKLRELRELTPTLKDFLDTVKWFSDVDDLDRALDKWTTLSATDRG